MSKYEQKTDLSHYFVYTSLADYVVSIRRLLSVDYFYYVSCKVPSHKISAFIEKIEPLYQLNETAIDKSRRYNLNQPTVEIRLFNFKGSDDIFCILMARFGCDGSYRHLFFEREKFKDARRKEQRISVGHYEFLRINKEAYEFTKVKEEPKQDEEKSKKIQNSDSIKDQEVVVEKEVSENKDTNLETVNTVTNESIVKAHKKEEKITITSEAKVGVWTLQLTEDYKTQIKADFKAAALQRNKDKMYRVANIITKLIGFHKVRIDYTNLHSYFSGTIIKLRKSDPKYPFKQLDDINKIPSNLRYFRPQKEVEKLPLSLLIKENNMVKLKQNEPAKVKFTMLVSKGLADEINALIKKIPANYNLEFDDTAKQIIKDLQSIVASIGKKDS